MASCLTPKIKKKKKNLIFNPTSLKRAIKPKNPERLNHINNNLLIHKPIINHSHKNYNLATTQYTSFPQGSYKKELML